PPQRTTLAKRSTRPTRWACKGTLPSSLVGSCTGCGAVTPPRPRPSRPTACWCGAHAAVQADTAETRLLTRCASSVEHSIFGFRGTTQRTIARFRPQFEGDLQHDAHELLAF